MHFLLANILEQVSKFKTLRLVKCSRCRKIGGVQISLTKKSRNTPSLCCMAPYCMNVSEIWEWIPSLLSMLTKLQPSTLSRIGLKSAQKSTTPTTRIRIGKSSSSDTQEQQASTKDMVDTQQLPTVPTTPEETSSPEEKRTRTKKSRDLELPAAGIKALVVTLMQNNMKF